MLLISKIQMNILLSLEIFYITICEDSIDEITKKMTREISTKRNAKLCFWWQQNTLVAKCILLIIKSVFTWPLHFSQLLSLVLSFRSSNLKNQLKIWGADVTKYKTKCLSLLELLVMVLFHSSFSFTVFADSVTLPIISTKYCDYLIQNCPKFRAASFIRSLP